MVTMLFRGWNIEEFEYHFLLSGEFAQSRCSVSGVKFFQALEDGNDLRKSQFAFEFFGIIPDPIHDIPVNDESDHVNEQSSIKSFLRLHPSAGRIHFVFERIEKLFHSISTKIIGQE